MTNLDEDKRPELRLILGGKSPPGDGITPYLLYLKWGALFHAKDKQSKDPISLILFKQIFIFPRARLLMDLDTRIVLRADPIEFCRRFELFEILFEGKEDDEPVNRADSAAGVQDYEPPEGIDSLDEGTKG